MKTSFENWKKEILIASEERENEGQFNKFVDLVEMLDGKEGIEVLRVLMKTFSDKPDYGSQEYVNSIFLKFPEKLVIQAVLEELPRLEVESTEQLICVLSDRLHFSNELLINVINSMDKRYRDLFRKWVNTPEFIKDFPQTVNILKQLKD